MIGLRWYYCVGILMKIKERELMVLFFIDVMEVMGFGVMIGV